MFCLTTKQALSSWSPLNETAKPQQCGLWCIYGNKVYFADRRAIYVLEWVGYTYGQVPRPFPSIVVR